MQFAYKAMRRGRQIFYYPANNRLLSRQNDFLEGMNGPCREGRQARLQRGSRKDSAAGAVFCLASGWPLSRQCRSWEMRQDRQNPLIHWNRAGLCSGSSLSSLASREDRRGCLSGVVIALGNNGHGYMSVLQMRGQRHF